MASELCSPYQCKEVVPLRECVKLCEFVWLIFLMNSGPFEPILLIGSRGPTHTTIQPIRCFLSLRFVICQSCESKLEERR